MTHTRVVAAVLIQDQEVLVAQRGSNMTHPGLWELPGGKVEPGEGDGQALARELTEELSITVEVHEFVDHNVHRYSTGSIHLLAYRCEIIGGEPQAREHAQIKWVPVSEMNSLEWAEADIPIVQQVIRHYIR